jgi:membrane protein YqaA with SNARE-associated domain
MAKPILPLEWLVMPRTGSMASKVGPAVTSTLRPASSLGWKKAIQRVAQLGRFQHAAVAHFAAGLVAAAGAQQGGAVGHHLGHIALRGRVRPHLAVHGRRHQQRAALDRAGQAQQAEQVVGPALRQLGDEIGAGRRHEMASASRERLMCAMLLGSRASHWLVYTGRPDSACIVTGVMNCVAASVITTCTVAPWP